MAKAHLPLGQMLTLAILSGAFISLGAAAYLMVMSGALGNLFWVTLGNILGGAGGVAMAYRYAYLDAKRSAT